MENEVTDLEQHRRNWFIWALLLCCLAVILSSFYFFFYKKDYDFIVEVACDSAKEICFSRDCTNPDDCPPNELSTFKRYSLNASDFKYCENEDCAQVCEIGQIKCEPVTCAPDVETGESCTTLPAQDAENNLVQ